MKKISFKPLEKWLGHSRRERRSSIFIILIIAAVAGIRYMVPSSGEPVEMIPVDMPYKAADSLVRGKPLRSNMARRPEVHQKDPIRILELNSCDSASLEALPGIGPVLSARIIKYRNLLGGYANVDQLREVYGLTEETFNLIKNRVKADVSLIRKVNINNADYKQLMRFRYLEKQDINEILKYRELMGKIGSLNELVENKVLTQEKADRMRWYVEY